MFYSVKVFTLNIQCSVELSRRILKLMEVYMGRPCFVKFDYLKALENSQYEVDASSLNSSLFTTA